MSNNPLENAATPTAATPPAVQMEEEKPVALEMPAPSYQGQQFPQPIGTPYQQQQSYQQQQQQQQYVTMQPSALPPLTVIWSTSPQPCVCPYCKMVVQSNVQKEMGAGAFVAAGFLCIFCCCCAWIPCVSQECWDAKHSCPHCNQILGEKKLL